MITSSLLKEIFAIIKLVKMAVEGVQYISHQAALGSVPRSIEDPILSNSANITGFLNMLVGGQRQCGNQTVCVCGFLFYVWR